MESRRWEAWVVHEIWLVGSMIALGVFQATLLPAPFGYPPALLLVLIVCQSLLSVGSLTPDTDVLETLRRAIYGGLTLDVCGATPLGSHVLALLLAATLIMTTTRQIRIGGLLLPLIATTVGGIVYELVLALLYQLTSTPLVWLDYGIWIALPGVLMTLILGLPTFYLLRWRTALREA